MQADRIFFEFPGGLAISPDLRASTLDNLASIYGGGRVLSVPIPDMTPPQVAEWAAISDTVLQVQNDRPSPAAAAGTQEPGE